VIFKGSIYYNLGIRIQGIIYSMTYPQIIKIYATSQEPSFEAPWQSSSPSSGSGSGVIISSGRILTGAHVVANATFIQVQKNSHPNKVIAKVKSICHDCDLALLEVPKSFTRGIKAPSIGDLPDLQDKVSVIGFPIGGDEISITEGVVSRVEIQKYTHSQRSLIAVTVDAAINDGNSGGPVFKDGKIVGIAFQAMDDAQNIGEIVPATLIKHFLKRANSKSVVNIPGIGFVWQNMENPILRKHVGLKSKQSGVYIIDVEYSNSGYGIIKKGDILTKIDGYDVSNNGTIKYMGMFRTQFKSFLCDHYIGDIVTIEVFREGKRVKLQMELTEDSWLVARSSYDIIPRYFIVGGLVFQPLSRDYLETWNKWWKNAPPSLLHLYYNVLKTEEVQEMVTITKILADEINMGYEELYDETILKINGIVPKNMAHFIEIVESSPDIVEIYTSEFGKIVMDIKNWKNEKSSLLERYNINSDRSKNYI
jgi:S1-C subfamily serine protease